MSPTSLNVTNEWYYAETDVDSGFLVIKCSSLKHDICLKYSFCTDDGRFKSSTCLYSKILLLSRRSRPISCVSNPITFATHVWFPLFVNQTTFSFLVRWKSFQGLSLLWDSQSHYSYAIFLFSFSRRWFIKCLYDISFFCFLFCLFYLS